MKKVILFCMYLIIFGIYIFTQETYSQMINKWEIVDSTNSKYFSYYTNKDNISGYDKNSIAVIGGKINLMNYYKNIYTIRLYENMGASSKVIFQDAQETSHRLLSIAHPSDSLIVVVGDSCEYQGVYPEKPPSQTWYKFWSLLMVSTDKGNSWQRKILDSNQSNISISMCDNMNGIIYQKSEINYFYQEIQKKDSLLITNNGWSSYRSITLPNDIGFIYQCYILKENHFFLRGSNYIYYSLNGGQNWIKTSEVQDYIMDMEIIDDRTFYIVSNIKPYPKTPFTNFYVSNFYKTSDAGETWIECKEFFKNSPKYSLVYCIDFYDKFNGIATFSSDIMLKTTDGGDTWTNEYIPYIFEVGTFNFTRSPYYPNEDFCFVTGEKNYTFVYRGEKILSKPKFIEKINRINQSTKEFKIEWEAVNGASGYKLKIDTVYRNGNLYKSEFENPWMSLVVFDRNFYLGELDYNTFYVFWLKAINNNLESDWSNYEIFTVDSNGYFSPEIIEPYYRERISNSTVTIKWNKVVPVERYKIEIFNSVNDDFISKIVTDTTYSLENLIPSAYYLITLASYYGNSLLKNTTSYFKTETVLNVDNKKNDEFGNAINIFPNPVDEKCNIIINSNFKSFGILKIYNLLGELIQRKEILLKGNNNGFQINTENFAPGIYFVEIINSNDIKRGIFIKQ